MKANQIEKLCRDAQQHRRHLDGLLIHTMTIILTVGAVGAVINEGWDRVTLDPKVLGVAAVALRGPADRRAFRVARAHIC